MNAPRLPLGQLNVCREGTVHWDGDIVALSVGPGREPTPGKQGPETLVKPFVTQGLLKETN